MTDHPRRSTMILFGSMAVYIMAQFAWWAVLLLRQDSETHRLAMEVLALGGEPGALAEPGRGRRMVMGEGAVFFLLLIVLLLLTWRAMRRDLALARSQRNFLLAVTHELRTPIAAIKLKLQTLARPGVPPEHLDALKTGALGEVDRLASLTDKVLLATQAQEGLLALDHSKVEVMALLRGVMERARAGHAHGHRLDLSGPGQLIVKSDGAALRSIAENLVENAAKYAPPGTTILLEVLKGREGWRIQVADEGPGIPPKERERIFQRFYRAGNEETRQSQGTGLGLYIVDRLTKRLGGQVTVQERPGGGSIFAASFPEH
ncbi:MAG: HAMP domain-containing histidine kinase [Flavobacteriales bacterium]|nr:HAMP domain-containing histidine kinase [Flavobacteriales bacterium]